MTEYKKDDKVVIIGTVTHGEDKFGNLSIDLPNGDYPRHALKTNEVSHLTDFQLAEEKIKFTVEEKREFNKLKATCIKLFAAFDAMTMDAYPCLTHKLFCEEEEECNYNQIEFARAWGNPELIEVVEPEKHEVKVGANYLRSYSFTPFGEKYEIEHLVGTASTYLEQFNLTLDEVKEAEKQLGIQGLQAKWNEVKEAEKQLSNQRLQKEE